MVGYEVPGLERVPSVNNVDAVAPGGFLQDNIAGRGESAARDDLKDIVAPSDPEPLNALGALINTDGEIEYVLGSLGAA